MVPIHSSLYVPAPSLRTRATAPVIRHRHQHLITLAVLRYFRDTIRWKSKESSFTARLRIRWLYLVELSLRSVSSSIGAVRRDHCLSPSPTYRLYCVFRLASLHRQRNRQASPVPFHAVLQTWQQPFRDRTVPLPQPLPVRQDVLQILIRYVGKYPVQLIADMGTSDYLPSKAPYRMGRPSSALSAAWTPSASSVPL